LKIQHELISTIPDGLFDALKFKYQNVVLTNNNVVVSIYIM